jgi:hypothetical protein
MRVAFFVAAMMLSACRDAQPPLPTRDESAQLDEAEDLLNQAAKEEGPEAQASDPSNRSD